MRDLRAELAAERELLGGAGRRDHARAVRDAELHGGRADAARARVHEQPLARRAARRARRARATPTWNGKKNAQACDVVERVRRVEASSRDRRARTPRARRSRRPRTPRRAGRASARRPRPRRRPRRRTPCRACTAAADRSCGSGRSSRRPRCSCTRWRARGRAPGRGRARARGPAAARAPRRGGRGAPRARLWIVPCRVSRPTRYRVPPARRLSKSPPRSVGARGRAPQRRASCHIRRGASVGRSPAMRSLATRCCSPSPPLPPPARHDHRELRRHGELRSDGPRLGLHGRGSGERDVPDLLHDPRRPAREPQPRRLLRRDGLRLRLRRLHRELGLSGRRLHRQRRVPERARSTATSAPRPATAPARLRRSAPSRSRA